MTLSGAEASSVLHRLSAAHLRLALVDVITSSDPAERRLEGAHERLWREDPKIVAAAFDLVILSRDEGCGDGDGRHGLRAERMRELRRPMSSRSRRGLTVTEIAKREAMRPQTLARLLERHGYLEMSPFGQRQSRRLVTAECYAAGHGHNVDPTETRSGRLDGAARAAPFPVFYDEHVASIMWTLGWDVIRATVAALPGKKSRLAYLLTDHDYLPDAEIADLAGYSRESIARTRARALQTGHQKAAA